MKCPQCGTPLVSNEDEPKPLHLRPQDNWPKYRCPMCSGGRMFRVMAFAKDKSVYEVSSLDEARRLAKEYSRSLARWMDQNACWVEIRDVAGVVVDKVNGFK